MQFSRKIFLVPIVSLAFLSLTIAVPAFAKNPPAPTTKPAIASFYADPQSVKSGSGTTLRWSVTGATSLSIDQGVGAVSKSSKFVTPKISTVYTLTATNAAGSTTATTSVIVIVPTVPPTCTLSALPTSITMGSSSVLTFTSTNATSSIMDQGVGTIPLSGTKSVSPATTTTYTATFTGAGGSIKCSTKVTVTSASTTPPGEIRKQAYTTSYSYWDNTPVGSAAIAYPVLHQTAGGTGTYTDPITIAVGYSIINGQNILDYPVGTKFYIPNVRRYFIVEDLCGDSATPQNGPCHTGYPAGTSTWVDMWIDGQSGTATAVHACAAFLTDTNGTAHLLIQNPASNYVVVSGAIFQNGTCTQQYGNVPVTL